MDASQLPHFAITINTQETLLLLGFTTNCDWFFRYCPINMWSIVSLICKLLSDLYHFFYILTRTRISDFSFYNCFVFAVSPCCCRSESSQSQTLWRILISHCFCQGFSSFLVVPSERTNLLILLVIHSNFSLTYWVMYVFTC